MTHFLPPDRLQGLAPRDDLVEHGLQLRLAALARLECREVLEIVEQGEPHLGAHRGDHELGHDEPQSLGERGDTLLERLAVSGDSLTDSLISRGDDFVGRLEASSGKTFETFSQRGLGLVQEINQAGEALTRSLMARASTGVTRANRCCPSADS